MARVPVVFLAPPCPLMLGSATSVEGPRSGLLVLFHPCAPELDEASPDRAIHRAKRPPMRRAAPYRRPLRGDESRMKARWPSRVPRRTACYRRTPPLLREPTSW